MAIGSVIKNKFMEYKDEHTGVLIKRLTEPDHVSHHMYFYNRMTTADGSKLLYCAELHGQRQLYFMDMNTGDAIQLTSGEDLGDYGAELSMDDKYVFYQQGNVIFRLCLETLERESVYEIPKGYRGGNWGMSDDNRFLVLVETEISSMPEEKKGANWDFFAITCKAKPHCRIVYIDMQKGTFHTVLEDNCWFGHAQIRPGDPDTILFCHEGPYDLIDARLWLVQSDGSNYRCCKEQPNDLILTHEFWLPDGSEFAFVYRETTGDKIENIRMINPDTMEETVFMECSPYAHFISDRENQYMVGDSQSGDVPIHLLNQEETKEGDQGEKNDYIYLVDVKNRKEQKLCYHGSSWKAKYGNTQDAHPHPCFSADNRYVIFVSDKEGMPCIYRVELGGNLKLLQS
ncbi:oligogalacturonate lyase family protein [Lachnospiraceae bacterium OttesenSCG-928-D06]|nr:oligogalacturonate lyase family protein [Lachnospiraceae bacterium OttesenSCG-928-D06]